MFSCRRATRLVSDRLERPLSPAERVSLGVHLLGCGPCRRFQRAVRWLHGGLPAGPDDRALPAEARERIRLALERAAGDG